MVFIRFIVAPTNRPADRLNWCAHTLPQLRTRIATIPKKNGNVDRGTMNRMATYCAWAQKTVPTRNQKDKTFSRARNHYGENSKYAQTVGRMRKTHQAQQNGIPTESIQLLCTEERERTTERKRERERARETKRTRQNNVHNSTAISSERQSRTEAVRRKKLCETKLKRNDFGISLW